MKPKKKLSASMTVTQFDHGYWYATELKLFATRIGIRSATTLRKDQLEKGIRDFLKTGKIRSSKGKAAKGIVKDVERGLSLDLPVVRYTNDKETKAFLEREAAEHSPAFRRRSGARYRLNRWREAQLANGVRLTYGGLVRAYLRLCRAEEHYDRVPTGRYINFMSDFLASEKNGTRAQAIRAWKELKALDLPKDYRSWVKSRTP